ncbi:MAG: PilZ domain-containing protein [Bacteriovoracia bacterium]
MNPPIFIRGHLEFKVGEITMHFKNKYVSVFGVTGLPWTPLNPQKHFATRVQVKITIEQPKAMILQAGAYITREQTAYGEYMGLRFILDDQSRKTLGDLILKHGLFPTNYIRKYPRIPSSNRIQTYPLQILGNHANDRESPPIIFAVRNLSLGGVLVASESPFAVTIVPGSKLTLHLEPRGDFSIQISVQGLVCRVLEEINPGNGNVIRYFGIRFTKVDEDNKNAFLELLRDILVRIKESNAVQIEV